MIRRRLAVLAMVLALVGIGVWKGPTIWTLLTTHVVYARDGEQIIQLRLFRGQSDVNQLMPGEWHSHTAWSATTGTVLNRYSAQGETEWDLEGRIIGQYWADELTLGGSRESPPWRWGEADQTVPTAPWVLAGTTVDDWWERLPGGMKGKP